MKSNNFFVFLRLIILNILLSQTQESNASEPPTGYWKVKFSQLWSVTPEGDF